MSGDQNNGNPSFTVCICTRNRVKYLGPTIESVLAQKVSSGAFDVLVVDNGSTDGTSEMIAARFGRGTCEPVRCIREEVPGLSRARNRAIAETIGDFIVFLDDDAIPEPGWLQAIVAGFGAAEIQVVGGAVVPAYEQAPPPWWSARIELVFAPHVSTFERHRVSQGEYPHGANIAFRRAVFARVGLFREDLGYSGNKLIPAEESELLLRIEKSGGAILYEPAAVVRHLIPASRMDRKYLRARFYGAGLASHELEKTRRHDVERWGFRQILDGWARGFRLYVAARAVIHATFRMTDGTSFDRELTARFQAGQAVALVREAIRQFKSRLVRGQTP
ncbi:MAG TPA: glycosyltransferase [Kiritimatiellia bacterium]|nr:glycosyltransferase [Kiritimatiellia bacterium]